MLRGMYGAGAGMIAQQRRQEMLSNNVANANTPGYKADQGSLRTFPQQLIQAVGTDHPETHGSRDVGTLATGVYMQERTPNFTQGDMRETGNSTDAALLQGGVPEDPETGNPAMLAFEAVNDDGDVRYTRNGNFAIDGEGFLTTPDGYYVRGEDGEAINVATENIDISEDGVITDADEDVLGQLNVVVIPDAENLVKEGSGLLNYEGEEEIVTAIGNDETEYQIQQGALEGSNVDVNRTMSEMMATMRSFEANQQVLQAYDQSMERAANDIGRLQ
ncbi:flagellar hook-basal body protein [Salisediminibacterium halotolerans]|uniref:flagellar hook-basal body protein n=1 Tax=Salisediminibacterium halotolerans TaxID=517425 RepID=UPI000EAE5680|nr:flagellar hook-basal body protein [Salisediminibacterium halotolerans]RLJ75779.1 flagellar basal-body rod protein FlgG [Actinophytocola xinjiangensis]RPE89633.1 flagellar basal-body rod protein FlgG [Salisediminibacterium halotolerans]TWG36392.1 flagellar basal-body rod protein FlgG [Salisediminibacterium halotolerans]GEL07530.1 flagellar hook-basal body complex protein FlhO [Salisediminibacterium halotolerans]